MAPSAPLCFLQLDALSCCPFFHDHPERPGNGVTYRKQVDPRYDGNGNLRAEYRTPYILDHIARAKAAGLPEELCDMSRGEDAPYAELVTRISLLPTSAPTPKEEQELLRQCREWEGLIAFLLEENGIQETAVTGDLVPRRSRLVSLIARTHAHQRKVAK